MIIQTPAVQESIPNAPGEIMHGEIATVTPLATTVTSVTPITNKSGALDKIRQRFTNPNGATPPTAVKPLLPDELHMAWNHFTGLLKGDKNPAAQSFERATLNIVNNDLFQIVSGNNLEQKFIEQQRHRLCEHLQVWFNNKSLSYQLVIGDQTEDQVQSDVALNSREQYYKMIEQFPLVKELKERLRLELDY